RDLRLRRAERGLCRPGRQRHRRSRQGRARRAAGCGVGRRPAGDDRGHGRRSAEEADASPADAGRRRHGRHGLLSPIAQTRRRNDEGRGESRVLRFRLHRKLGTISTPAIYLTRARVPRIGDARDPSVARFALGDRTRPRDRGAGSTAAHGLGLRGTERRLSALDRGGISLERLRTAGAERRDYLDKYARHLSLADVEGKSLSKVILPDVQPRPHARVRTNSAPAVRLFSLTKLYRRSRRNSAAKAPRSNPANGFDRTLLSVLWQPLCTALNSIQAV